MRSHSFLAVLTVGLAAAGCQEEAARPPAPDRPVLVHAVLLEPSAPERSFVATIGPRVESELSFRVGGKVAERLVDVGDAVRAGQPLARLDDADLRLQHEQAEAERDAAKATLAQAEAELGRLAKLRRAGHATQSAVERQEALVGEARSRALRGERAASLASNALAYATLTANGEGVVTAVSVEPGQVVSSGDSAIRIALLSEKEAVVAVPEALLAGLGDAKAALTLWSAPGQSRAVRLRELSPTADPATRTFQARFSIPGAGEDVRLGMTGTVTLRGDGGDRVARLPLAALIDQGGGPAVWVVGSDGRPELRGVEVAAYEARHVVVRGGLRNGDRVVALGAQKLDAGQTLRVVPALEF